MAYALFSLGVQFGGPFTGFNEQLIDWLGWRATFEFLALMGFVNLGMCVLFFDEPERGRFDIAQSVVVNPDESHKSNTIGYALSEAPTGKRLDIKAQKYDEGSKMRIITDYLFALRELFVNDAANWLLVAACLRTMQGIALGLFTNDYFNIYPDKMYEYNMLS